jgi:metallophosphoesterase (TIGR00282 family)
MNILIIGDVVGSPGRAIMKKALPRVFTEHDIDYCIANVENAAGGFGVTKDVCDEILDMGVDCMTSGNHIWDKKEILGVVDLIPQLLRPLNYPREQPGRGSFVGRGKDSKVPVATLNLSGRVFMNGAMDDPFALALIEVERLRKETPIIIVDIHAEATSEKTAMGHHLDGKVSAVVGTHTHVPTCDHAILPKGTAYLTDLGMTGALRLGHRRRGGDDPQALHHRHAHPLRDGQGRPALRGGGGGRGREDGAGQRHHADAAGRGRPGPLSDVSSGARSGADPTPPGPIMFFGMRRQA